MAGVRAIEHVQLAMPVGREAEARAFYGEVLGLRETPKPPDLAGRGGCWFEEGPVKLHLGVEADFRPARKAHVALLVDDIEALLERARRTGFETSAPEPLHPYVRAFVFDPFGNRIELMQRA